jgi:phosphate-selective porin OprO/OprP
VLALLIWGSTNTGVSPLYAQAPAPAPREASTSFRPPNSIRIGDVRVDLRVRLHQDFRRFSIDSPAAGWEPTFRRARVGVQGQITNDLQYDFDAELRDREHPLRNAFVNFSRFESAEIRAGRFKMPFGREQIASIFEMDFIERSLINSTLVPTRDTGVMLHGEVGDGIFAYRTGVFAHDGDTSRFDATAVNDGVGDLRAGNGVWLGRIIIRPWAQSGGALRRIEIAGAMTVTSLDEGLFGVEGRTLSGYRFSPRVYVRGQRTRAGIDGSWTRGSVGVQAEYIRLRDEREGQGPGNVDLPDAIAQGWYVSAAWTLTGEAQGEEFSPRRPLFGGGYGAVEVAARMESIGFGGGGPGGEAPGANPRAPNLLENRDRILTFGVNWYPNRWGRVLVHATREQLQDRAFAPVPPRSTFWGVAWRLQLAM